MDAMVVHRLDGYEPAGFFLLRTPLLPWRAFIDLAAPAGAEEPSEADLDAQTVEVHARLRGWVLQPAIREAILLASPSLEEKIDAWARNPLQPKMRRVTFALLRYFTRAAGRPTPFGLFAGYAIGSIAAETRLAVPAVSQLGRRTRFDHLYLSQVVDGLLRSPQLRKKLVCRPSSSLYEIAGRFRYAEPASSANGVRYTLTSVEATEHLRRTLERARSGATAERLAQSLVDDDPEVSSDEAHDFVGELIECHILETELSLAVTGGDPLAELVSVLVRLGEDALASVLSRAREKLAELDERGLGCEVGAYRGIAAELEVLPYPVQLPRLFQVDLVKRGEPVTLGSEVVDEAMRALSLARRLSPAGQSSVLAEFQRAFVERFGDREVRLVDALDDEIGIGFARSNEPNSDTSPLLDGLVFPPREDATQTWTTRDNVLLALYGDAIRAGRTEIELTDSDIEHLTLNDEPATEDAFEVMMTLAAASESAAARGDYRIWFHLGVGGAATRTMARFCQGDAELTRCVLEACRKQEAARPEAIYAEIAHFPEGRVGNIVARPLLREYDIPYLGRSGAALERQIAVSDLLISIRGGRVVLRSARLNREVIPCNTTAFKHTSRANVSMFRFLCAVRNASSAGWIWGPLYDAPFLPRIRYGRFVLHRAQWTIWPLEALRPFVTLKGQHLFERFSAWRVTHGVPKVVCIEEGELDLPVDLGNLVGIEMFVDLLKDRPRARLVELYPGPEELCAEGPEGRYVHEISLPLIRRSSAAEPAMRAQVDASRSPPAPTLEASPTANRRFSPGSEWAYAKIYAAPSLCDEILVHLIGPLLRDAVARGEASSWHFIHYADPEHHLRVRVHGDAAQMREGIIHRLERSMSTALEERGAWKVQWDTYEREVERYGGPRGMVVAEQVFHADSEAALTILSMLSPGSEGAEARWRLTLVGIDRLLRDFGLNLAERAGFAEDLRERYANEFRRDLGLRKSLDRRFRSERQALDESLDVTATSEHGLAPGAAVYDTRSAALRRPVSELAELSRRGLLTSPLIEVVTSFVHMHAIRMCRSNPRAHELVIYDFLARLYRSRVARARS